MTATTPVLECRWLRLRDLPRVLEIEAATVEHRNCGPAWDKDTMLATLRERQVAGFGCDAGSDEVESGYMVLRYEATHIHLLRFAAVPGTGAGPVMMRKLFRNISQRNRKYVYYATPDGPGALWDRMPELRPEWLTDDVRAMCSGAAPADPAILADALQDAGCDDDGLLSDLRERGIGELVCQWLADTTR